MFDSVSLAGLLVGELQESLWNSEVTNACSHTGMGSGVYTWVLTLAWQVFLPTEPSPQFQARTLDNCQSLRYSEQQLHTTACGHPVPM